MTEHISKSTSDQASRALAFRVACDASISDHAGKLASGKAAKSLCLGVRYIHGSLWWLTERIVREPLKSSTVYELQRFGPAGPRSREIRVMSTNYEKLISATRLSCTTLRSRATITPFRQGTTQ